MNAHTVGTRTDVFNWVRRYLDYTDSERVMRNADIKTGQAHMPAPDASVPGSVRVTNVAGTATYTAEFTPQGNRAED